MPTRVSRRFLLIGPLLTRKLLFMTLGVANYTRGGWSGVANYTLVVTARKKIIWNRKLCYKCLKPNHMKQNCNYRGKCYLCKPTNHRTAICDKNNKPRNETTDNKDSHLYLVNMKTSVFLQTVSGEICDQQERKKIKARIILDSGSQRSYISERIVDKLRLKPDSTQDMEIKTFGNLSNQSITTSEYVFCLKGVGGDKLYLKGFSVPTICSPLKGQRHEEVKKHFPFLNDLNLNDPESDEVIDVFDGADFYWTIVSGNITRCGANGFVAMNSKLGYVLSDPLNYNRAESSTVNLTYAMKVEMGIKEDISLDQKVGKFWNLDSVGIVADEESVYDKFESTIKYENDRYEVMLPLKENRPMLEDNYAVSFEG